MKRTLVIAVCLLACAGMAFAQAPGSIEIFSDVGYSDCNFIDATVGLVPMYIVHMRGEYVASCAFRLVEPECNAMSNVGTTVHFAVSVGNLFTGISIAYGGCYGGSPILLATTNWFASGLTPTCCYFSIAEDPAQASGLIEVADCDLNRMFATGGTAIVNPVPDVCECDTPVSDSTWGGIKALYK